MTSLLRWRPRDRLPLREGEAARACAAAPDGVVVASSHGRIFHQARSVHALHTLPPPASSAPDFSSNRAELQQQQQSTNIPPDSSQAAAPIPPSTTDTATTPPLLLPSSSSTALRDTSCTEPQIPVAAAAIPTAATEAAAPAAEQESSTTDTKSSSTPESNTHTDSDHDNAPRVSILSLAVSRTTALSRKYTLPEQLAFALALAEGHGVAMFSLPELTPVLFPELTAFSQCAQLMVVDQLDQINPSDSFRMVLTFKRSDLLPGLGENGSTNQDSQISKSPDPNSSIPVPGPKDEPSLTVAAATAASTAGPNGSVVVLLSVTPSQVPVLQRLGSVFIPYQVTALAFGSMTIVATTPETHCMVRVARDGSLAVAAQVQRFERIPKRAKRPRSMTPTPGALLSFLGGFGSLFSRRGAVAEEDKPTPVYAIALPEDRWLLVVDNELVVYSSFGAKIEDMENVFKSKAGMSNRNGSIKADANLTSDSATESLARGLVRSVSGASIASAATAASARTLIPDESEITRSDRLPLDTVFTSPFVLSMASATELLVFSANGSFPGAIDSLSLFEQENVGQEFENGTIQSSVRAPAEIGKDDEKWVHLVSTPASLPRLAFVTWPNGRVVEIELSKDLQTLTDEHEQANELRLALALVPVEDTERTLALRRLLATEARAMDLHSVAIKHMEVVVNIASKSDLYSASQQDLIMEAVELRGPTSSSWQDDAATASLWADFLYQLRRRIMRPGQGDAAVLETICAVDTNATRVKTLLSVPHAIPCAVGESCILSPDCCLDEDQRVAALVTLYQSLDEHDKALSLLEESNRPLDDICQYLISNVNQDLWPDTYFKHLGWFAANSERHEKMMQVIFEKIPESIRSQYSLTETLRTLVKAAPNLIPTYIEQVVAAADLDSVTIPSNRDSSSHDQDSAEIHPKSHIVILARSLLSAMVTAQQMEKRELVSQLRPIFRSQVLHRSRAEYDAKAMLAALNDCPGLDLHEELAFVYGQQGEHALAAMELAAEKSISASEAKKRLRRSVPPHMYQDALNSLAAAYLSMDPSKRSDGAAAAAEIVASERGHLDAPQVLRDASKDEHSMKLRDVRDFAVAAISAATERLRIADMMQAIRQSEVRRLKEELLVRRRQHIIITRDRVCSKCSRLIGDSVIAAYPDGSVTHLGCHLTETGRSANSPSM